jgi:hypothetical protein
VNGLQVRNMRPRKKRNAFIGWLAGVLSSWFGGQRTKPTQDDLRRVDFNASTQRLGIRFSKKIRDVFRFKWLKKR